MKNIVHLTSVHSPADTRIFHKQCKTLTEVGYRVTLVVPTDQDETREEVIIKAVPSPSSRLDRVLKTTRHVLRAAISEDADLYHLHDSELLPVGLVLRALGYKVVYDAHENLPKSLEGRPWIPSYLKQIGRIAADVLERLLTYPMTGVIAATPSIRKRFSHVSQTALIQNFPLLTEFEDLEPQSPYNRRPKDAVYIGSLTRARGAKEMIQATTTISSGELQLILGGKFGDLDFRDSCFQSDGWRNTQFKGWLTREEVGHVLSEARTGLVVLQPVPNLIDAQPTKMYEYMAAGLPVVASDFPLWRQIVEESQCGLLVDPTSPEEIGEAIQWLLDHPDEAEKMGQRGRKAVFEKYNWDNEVRTLLSFYEEVLSSE